MARIPEAEIEPLKRSVDLVALVRGSGVELRRSGGNWLGLCPWHADGAEPSLSVTQEKGLWHCFGCGLGGSAIDWVMKRDGVGFRRAFLHLKGEAPLVVPPSRRRAALPEAEADPAADAALLVEVVAHYRRRLLESPAALAYLESRGLMHPELVERFHLGYADRTLCYWLDERPDRAEARARLTRLGVLRASGHEHLAGSLVVPVFDAAGGVAELYGRKIGERLRKGTPDHLYLPGPHRGVWNRAGLMGQREVILCEAALDALSFWVAGLRNVTWSFGVNGFTAEMLSCFRELGVGRVLIAYDADEAGDRAATALAPLLSGAGIEAARVHFPRGLDANAYALAAPPASRSLAVLLEQAVPLEKPAERQAAKEGSDLPPLAALPSAAAVMEPARTPAPPGPVAAVTAAADGSGEEVCLSFGERSYRVRGLARNPTPDSLKINLLVRRGDALHVDTLDLYQARQRSAFALAAARELGCKEEVIRKELGSVLLKLEELQAERRSGAPPPEAAAPAMSEEEKSAALALLRSPDLLGQILADFDACGVVGEETNKLVGYLAATSRKLERPLAIIVQSASAAGKTSLMDAVLAFVPEEERIQYSALTGQSLFYMEGMDLKHKVLAVAEEEGAEKASYALKLLQSEGELRIASTGKDPQSGRLVTHEYRVEGPTMIFLTTTAVEVDEELLNRALVLTVDETPEQTRAIHRVQRERRTLSGLLARAERDDVLRLHRNAQRLLRPLAVVNPYAPSLTFLDSRTRTRRDHEKYLTLIDAIALLHQHQREVKRIEKGGRGVEYVEATLEDIEQANRLADAVLGRSLDELPPQTRRFLEALHAWVRAQPPPAEDGATGEPVPVRFTAREVREALGTGATQTKLHLSRLLELEYLLATRSAHGQMVYALLYDGEGTDGRAFLVGLMDVARLQGTCDAQRPAPGVERSAAKAERSGSGRPLAGGRPAGGRSRQNEGNLRQVSSLPEWPAPEAGNALPGAALPARHTVAANGLAHASASAPAAAAGGAA